MDDVDQRCDEFADYVLQRAKFVYLNSYRKVSGKDTLRDLLSFPDLARLVLRHRGNVRESLKYLWGAFGVTAVQEILDDPDPSVTNLRILTDLLHDNVHYTIEIGSVMEAVSYALGNETIFGQPFENELLRGAAIQV